MTGLGLRVDGQCGLCPESGEDLVVVLIPGRGAAGVCTECIEMHFGMSPGVAAEAAHAMKLVDEVKRLEALEVRPTSSLDRCPTCGMSYCCDLCGGAPAPAGAKRWVVHVPEQPPSQNEFKAGIFPPAGANATQLRKMMLGQQGAYKRLVETWRKLLDERLRTAKVWRARGRRRVVFTRLLGTRNRAFDQFNLVGGLKPVCDALVHLEALVDDDQASFEGHARQRKPEPGELPGLRIEITELAVYPE